MKHDVHPVPVGERITGLRPQIGRKKLGRTQEEIDAVMAVLHTYGGFTLAQCSTNPNVQPSSLPSSHRLQKNPRLINFQRSNQRAEFLPCCGNFTVLKTSSDDESKWKRSRGLRPEDAAPSTSMCTMHSMQMTVCSPSRTAGINPKRIFSSYSRMARCSCKVFNDAGGEYEIGREGGENCEAVVESSMLHSLMEQAGIDTSHAQAARRNYAQEIAKLRISQSENVTESQQRSVDLARAALEIAAEDDALVSHSPVPLPVDAYLHRLETMALEFAGHHLPTEYKSPLDVLEALDLYLYGYQGFRRTKSLHTVDARVFYLNTVLTTRLGTPVMLALIYSELVKRLQHIGVINFSVDMELPENLHDLPHPRVTTQDGKIRSNAQTLLLTPQLLLVEVLRSLKQLYWPWRENGSIGEGTGFLQAATAAGRGIGIPSTTSAFDKLFNAPLSSGGAEVARARAAQLRLQRGIWTSSNFGDLRRALAASERLVLLGVDKQELRDYGMLLFHSGLYRRSFEYFNAYSSPEATTAIPATFDPLKAKEDVALERLLERLRLILAEQAWLGTSGTQFSSSEVPPDPW